uniref:No apical meristem-associated C-terminal domain-containing protein n=1 Tax=Brassica oleracea TaxID=3712 RepID=A0A3P6CNI7_BRAOL|nr:unnamed protein product [Brassica oleracea]
MNNVKNQSTTIAKQNGSNFVDLLTSQQESVFGHSQDPFTATQRSEETFVERRERRTWTPRDDIVLISAWLNTSKDPVVGNEQRSGDFWKRVGAYFAASPKAAKREKTSGQNDNDVLKKAHEIFYTNHKKFRLEHAFMELRHDQKWCDLSSSKTEGSSRKRKYEDLCTIFNLSRHRANTPEADEASNRPIGYTSSKFQTMWSIKQQDLVVKERLSKMSLLDSLIGKEGPLTDSEEALKKKLITDLLSV